MDLFQGPTQVVVWMLAICKPMARGEVGIKIKVKDNGKGKDKIKVYSSPRQAGQRQPSLASPRACAKAGNGCSTSQQKSP